MKAEIKKAAEEVVNRHYLGLSISDTQNIRYAMHHAISEVEAKIEMLEKQIKNQNTYSEQLGETKTISDTMYSSMKKAIFGCKILLDTEIKTQTQILNYLKSKL